MQWSRIELCNSHSVQKLVLRLPGGRAHIVSRNIRGLQDLIGIKRWNFVKIQYVQFQAFIQNEMKSRLSLNNPSKRNRESARGKGLVVPRAKFACLFIFSKLTSNLCTECGTFSRQKHLLFRTPITIADKSRSMIFFQGIACFFLPSHLSFSKAKLSRFFRLLRIDSFQMA